MYCIVFYCIVFYCFVLCFIVLNCDGIFLFRTVVKLMTGEGIHFCDQKKCIELRRVAVRNDKKFECSHIKKVLQCIEDDQIKPL